MSGGAGGTFKYDHGEPNILERVRLVADRALANGGTRTDINLALRRELGIEIGEGGCGTYPGIPPCPYCHAHGGGGHGGFCPGPVAGTSSAEPS
jgi:hypothetical protein